MSDRIRVGEFLVGVEGLALLRSAFDGPSSRAERLNELRELLAELGHDAALQSPFAGDEHDLDEGYEVWARSYDRPLRLFPIESPPVHRLLDAIRRGVVLDAACGTGRHSSHLVDIGHDVIGIDRSEAMLALARENVSQATFLRAELTSVPLRRASVDAALCALALVHVDDLDSVFREFARVVRRGGRVVVSDVHPTLVALGWQAQFPTGHDAGGFIRLRHHQMSDYVEAAIRNGFTVRGCREPALTVDAARTPAGGRILGASDQAFAGLPAVVVWDFERV